MAVKDTDKLQSNNYSADSYKHWKQQIEAAESWRSAFVKRGDRIVDRYRDEDNEYGNSKYNILYSNTETLLPVVYSTPPKADVRAKDPSQISKRKGASIIEDALNYYIEASDFDDVARLAVMDFLLSGIGQIRPKYQTTNAVEEVEIDLETTESVEQVVFEEVQFEYTHWRDFIYPECKSWNEVPWIAFKTRMSYEEAAEMFGKEKADLLNYEPIKTEYGKAAKQERTAINKALVYEIWDKLNREQVFFAEGTNINAPLEINEDPLELEGFFPTPQPLFSITTSGNLLPVPFFKMYESQALELDAVNARIESLVENMKRRGFYDASIKELSSLNNLKDNEFMPVKDWTTFAAKGGMQGAVSFESLNEYIQAIQVLTDRKEAILQDIYQIIGISDIRRAQTDPRETLGAQKMKGRYGTIRISTYQRKVANFFRDVLRIAGEIMINQFDPETLAIVTNRPLDTQRDKQTEEITEVGVRDLLTDLKTKSPSDVLVDIESDSTIVEDSEEDILRAKEAIVALVEFTGASTGLIQSLGIPATSEILMGIIEKFKLGRDIQQEVEDHLANIKKNGLPDKKDPQEILAESELKQAEIKAKTEQMKAMIDAQIKKAELQVKQQLNIIKAAELGVKVDLEQQKIDLSVLDSIAKAQALKAEAANPKDNAIVGA